MCHPHLVECPPFGFFCFAKASPPSKRWESVFHRSALRKDSLHLQSEEGIGCHLDDKQKGGMEDIKYRNRTKVPYAHGT
ncbi:hypothetical protein CDAR_30041 [Caerostris darwini]|uniref:Uncharacterized protein n=1 Tax=Caerostris darwini TaxID=1538125 RepID=A0AAV4TE96_9ARAC|nr:hypothetical protein CDAR_30041 [Caerostris darwini]